MDAIFTLSRHFLDMYNRPYRRYLLDRHSLESRLSVIIGPRGVGKTTAIVQHILSFSGDDPLTGRALYVPVDHFALGGKRLYDIAEAFHQLGGELVCFDEIHKYGDWSGELKSIYDSFPGLRVIATGSSAMLIEHGSHDLSRRALVYRMTGLSFREYIDINLEEKTPPLALADILGSHEKLTRRIVGQVEGRGRKILALFKQYLEYGYFPYFAQFSDVGYYHLTLEQGIHATIESDLMAVYPTLTGTSIRKLKKLLTVIADAVPFTPDLKRLKKIVDIGDERTLKNYLKFLEDGGVVALVPGSGTQLRQLEKPEKIYLGNPNQVCAISAGGKGNLGNIRETFFLNMTRPDHAVSIPKKGDFLVDERFTFEIGGRNKGYGQIKEIENAYLAVDDIEHGIGQKIPLWLFGFLY